MMIYNNLQGRIEEVKQEDGETIRRFEGSMHIVLSNGVWLRDLKDGRWIEEDETQWTEAYEVDEKDNILPIGLFYRL